MSDMVCVVTGSQTYKYMKLEENFRSFRSMHTQLFPRGRDDVSSEYTCHAWAKDKVQLVITTAEGDILICAMSGEFLIYVPDSPRGVRIDCVLPYSGGLILGCVEGRIHIYEGTENENQVYIPGPEYLSSNRNHPKDLRIESETIGQMVLSPEEDILYYIDRNNQLLQTNLSFDGSDPEAGYSIYVQGPFHNEKITGMDICLRKQLIVTCSANYICIWNWDEKKFELAWRTPPGEDATAVAFHPSGFHILAAVGDKFYMMNVLSNSLFDYHSF